MSNESGMARFKLEKKMKELRESNFELDGVSYRIVGLYDDEKGDSVKIMIGDNKTVTIYIHENDDCVYKKEISLK